MLYRYKCPKCNNPNTVNQLIDDRDTIMCHYCLKSFKPEGVIIMPEETKEEKHGSPTYYKLLKEMADTHDKKSHDYASNENPFGNYHFAGLLATMFSHSPEDAGFVGRIGEKLYRLANLERTNKSPKNESIEDTEVDIAIITTLWMADRKDRRMKKINDVLSEDKK